MARYTVNYEVKFEGGGLDEARDTALSTAEEQFDARCKLNRVGDVTFQCVTVDGETLHVRLVADVDMPETRIGAISKRFKRASKPW